jgi:methylase of polypeptide subunit release factors
VLSVPRADDPAAAVALASGLRAAGFTVEAIEERLGTHELSSRRIDVAVHARRLGEDPFGTLARLFLLGLPVDAGRVDEALAAGAAGLEALGLVRVEGTAVHARARLAPHGDYYVASDGASDAETPHDWVPGIQAPSVTLAKLAVRRAVARALDLGTGCGIQALLAAKHAERVVATDVNPRALAYAAFNARLNGVENVELRTGSAFEPVEGERFDLIVANPPYVISPDASYAYRDSGLRADELCRRIVADAPDHLEEGGFAHVLVSWVLDPDGDWAEPLRAWVPERGCDAWLLHYRTNDPLGHAAGWLRPLGETDADWYEAALDRWVSHLEDLGARAVGYGAVVLRRRGDGTPWVREDPLPLDKLEAAGEHTVRVFAGCDAVDRLSDDELLDTRPALTTHHVLRQELTAADGGYTVRSQVLELTDGLRFTVGVDRHTASLLPRLDGNRSLREGLAVAAAGSAALTDEERAGFEQAALPVVRTLLGLGFLELV